MPARSVRGLSLHRVRLFLAYGAALLRAKLAGRLGGAEHGRLLRQLFEALGCTATKLGQLLGMRRDVFSSAFCYEMSKVQDRALGFPGRTAARILQEDLGPGHSQVFSEFDETPFAAASIGQVHLARLRRDGRRVAVKIRRPFIVEQMVVDLRWIGRTFRLLAWLGVKPSFAWDDLFWELRTALQEEADYRLEASYAARMKKSLGPHEIHVPAVYPEFTTERVLVMDFIEGVSMADIIATDQEDPVRVARWLEENGISRAEIGRKLNHSMNRQIFEDNFFHSDLHPGNILLLRNGEIALIDFGAAGSLDADFLQKYSLYYQAIVGRQYDRAVDLLLLLAPQPPANARSEEFRRRYVAVMKHFETRTGTSSLKFHERSIVSVFGEIMKDLAALEIPLDWSFMRADRAQLTLDASLMYLLPEVDYLELTGDYWRDAKARSVTSSVKTVTGPRGWRGVAHSVGGLLEHFEDSQQVGVAALRAQATTARRAFGHMVLTAAAGLRLTSAALVAAIVGGGLTYLDVGAAETAARLHLGEVVASWRAFPPAIAVLVLLGLAGLLRKTTRLTAELLQPRAR